MNTNSNPDIAAAGGVKQVGVVAENATTVLTADVAVIRLGGLPVLDPEVRVNWKQLSPADRQRRRQYGGGVLGQTTPT